MSVFSKNNKIIYLGTAMWGWSVIKSECFTLLDYFYENGGRFIDTAKNYPINGDSNYFMFAENTLSEWLASNNISDCLINAKIGSISNQKISDNNLTSNYIISEQERLNNLFGNNLHTLMLHWDNRDDESEIIETVRTLAEIDNVSIGLSGIKYPDIYAKVLKSINYNKPLRIQIKYNFLQRNSISYYLPLSDFVLIKIAYGIGMSGIKLNKSDYEKNSYVSLSRDKDYHDSLIDDKVFKKISLLLSKYEQVKSIYDLSIIFSMISDDIDGFMIAPSKLSQIKSIKKTLNFYKQNQFNYSDFEL